MFYNGKYGGGYNVTLEKGRYSNGRTAIIAKDDDGCMAFTATVNLPEYIISNDEAFIKDYSENEGVLDFLIENNIVEKVIKYVPSGYVNIPLCKLNLNII